MTTFPTSVHGRTVEYFLGIEGTPAGTVSRYFRVRAFSAEFEMERSLVENNQLGGAAPNNPRDGQKQLLGMPNGTVDWQVPLNVQDLPLWLGLALPIATTGSAPNYTHTLASGGDPEHSALIAVKDGATSYRWLGGAVLQRLRLSLRKGDGVARAELTILPLADGRGSSLPNTPAATITAAAAQSDLREWIARAKWNTTLIGDILSLDLDIDFGAQRLDLLNGSEFAAAHHMGEIRATFSGEFYGYADAFDDIARDQTVAPLALEMVIDANTSLIVTLNQAQMAVGKQAVTGPDRVSRTITGAGFQGASPQVSIVVKNQVASYV